LWFWLSSLFQPPWFWRQEDGQRDGAVGVFERLFQGEDGLPRLVAAAGAGVGPHAVSSLPSMANAIGPVTRFLLLLSS